MSKQVYREFKKCCPYKLEKVISFGSLLCRYLRGKFQAEQTQKQHFQRAPFLLCTYSNGHKDALHSSKIISQTFFQKTGDWNFYLYDDNILPTRLIVSWSYAKEICLTHSISSLIDSDFCIITCFFATTHKEKTMRQRSRLCVGQTN